MTQVYHFHNGCGGGVMSVIKNLIKFSKNTSIESHLIYTINILETKVFEPEEIEGIASQQIFYYNPKNNFYYTCRGLAKLLPDEQCVIIAHDWVELGMASNLGLKNPVVQFLHGDFDYYYQLSILNNNAIDSIICISPTIFSNLNKLLSSRSDSIYNLKFPVPVIQKSRDQKDILNIIYYVRDLNEERKKFSIIVDIIKYFSIDDNYQFTIAGGGMTEEKFEKLIPAGTKNVHFVGQKSNTEIIDLLQSQDIFLLPSKLEGLPVALVEAMKAGLVPLVTNWNNATSELLIDGENGFYIKLDDVKTYTEKIQYFNNNRAVLELFSKRASEKANQLFDPYLNTQMIENVFQNKIINKNKTPYKVYGSRLDNPMLPNFLVRIARVFLNLTKSVYATNN